MNKRTLIYTAVFLLSVPILFRIGWFYRGFYFGNATVKNPSYEEILMPEPELSTAEPRNFIEKSETIKIVFDSGHLNRVSINEMEALISQLQANGAEVITLQAKQSLEPLLRGAQAFITIAPTDAFKTEEIQAIMRFTDRGGRVLVIADPTRSYTDTAAERDKSVVVANQLLAPYSMAFRNDYIYNIERNEGNFRNIFLQPTLQNAISSEIEEVVFYGAHSISGSGIALLTGDEKNVSSLTDMSDIPVAAALSLNGNVVALSDLTFMSAPYFQVKDNARFIANLASYLSTPRERDLNDFPILFSRPVGLILGKNVTLTKDLFNAISSLQDSLKSQGLTFSILDEAKEGYDLLVVGTYPPNEDIEKFLTTFSVTFGNALNQKPSPTPQFTSEPSPTSTAPSGLANTPGGIFINGFGSLPAKGFSYFLYDSSPTRNTLILLAEKADFCAGLVKVLASGSLRGCLLQTNIAVCKQDGAFISTPEPTQATDNTATPSTTPTALPTSTPTS